MDLSTISDADLQAELARRQQKPAYTVRPLEAIGAAEKCATFDRLYGMALCEWEQLCTEGDADDDMRTYMSEAVKELLAEPGRENEYWEARSALLR